MTEMDAEGRCGKLGEAGVRGELSECRKQVVEGWKRVGY